jgi:hypothetical protein
MKRFPSYCLIGLFLLAFSACGKIKQPDFKGIENIRTDRLGLEETNFTLDLLYYNPNKYGVKLKSAEGDAWIDTRLLGHFVVDTMIQIPPLANFRLPIKLAVTTKNMFQNSIVAMFQKEVTVKISGNARLGKAGIFINYPLAYEVKQPMSDFLK